MSSYFRLSRSVDRWLFRNQGHESKMGESGRGKMVGDLRKLFQNHLGQ